MKKLLSLALVLTMLFTIILVPSVSAADEVDESNDVDFKTAVKIGLEDGKWPFGTVKGDEKDVTENVFINAPYDLLGNKMDSNINHIEEIVNYTDIDVEAPSDKGEGFGDKVCRALVDTTKFSKYNNIRFRCPVPLNSSYSYLPKNGKKYKASVWVYVKETIDSSTSKAKAQFFIGDGDDEGTPQTKVITVNKGEWTKLEVPEFTPDSGWSKGVVYTVEFTGTPSQGYAKEILVDNFRLEEEMDETEWFFDESSSRSTLSGWTSYGTRDDNFLGNVDESGTLQERSNLQVVKLMAYDDIEGLEGASETCGDNLFVYDVTKPQVTEEDYNPIQSTEEYENVFWPAGSEKPMGFDEAYALLSSYRSVLANMAGRFRNIAPADSLKIGGTYKVSLKIYIAEKRDLTSSGQPVVEGTDTDVVLTGCRSGNDPVGDGKQVIRTVPYQEWTEVGYTFKATQKSKDDGVSLKIDISEETALEKMDKGSDEALLESRKAFPTLVYIDDVKVEKFDADDVNLVISEDSNKNTVTASAEIIDIKSVDALDTIVLIAEYDTNGKLIDVLTSEKAGVGAWVGEFITVTYPNTSKDHTYIAFAWDNLDNIKPYVLPVELLRSEE